MKRKKSKILLFLILLLWKGSTCNALSLDVKENFISGYDFIFEGQVHNLVLFEDKKTGLPLYQKDANLIFMNPRDYTEENELIPYSEEVLNACFLSTNGQKATDENLLERIAMQFYLYEQDAKMKKKEITYLFDPNQIHEIQDRLLSLGKKELHETTYSYTMVQQEWLTISNLPWEKDYHLEEQEGLTYLYTNSSLLVQSSLVKDSEVKVYVDEYQGQYHFYTSSDPYKPSYLFVEKPITLLPTLKFHVLQKSQDYEIHFPDNQEGYTLDISKKALENEQVEIKIDLENGYRLDQILVKTLDGNKIAVQNQTFLMPGEDVIIDIQVEKETYVIQKQVKNMDLKIKENAKFGEQIEVIPVLGEEDELKVLKVMTESGQEIKIINNNFVMPAENIFVIAEAKPKTYFLTLDLGEGVNTTLNSFYQVNEEVNLSYELQKHFEIKEIYLMDENNQKIKVENNKFLMPNKNVTLKIITQKQPKYFIQVQPIEGIQINVPLKSYSNEKVEITWNQEEQYQLKEVKVFTADLQEIKLVQNTFIMPNTNVFITGMSVQKYPIWVKNNQIFDIETEKEAFVGDTVKVSIKIKDSDYFVKDLIIQKKSGGILSVNQESFTMPKEEVFITAEAIKARYKISVNAPESFNLNVPNSAWVGERIVIDYQKFQKDVLEIEGNVLYFISNGQCIFYMPQKDVVLTVKEKSKESEKTIKQENLEENYEEYQEIENTYQENTGTILWLILFSFFLGMYAKKNRCF